MKVALVTGSANRIGCQIIKTLHSKNYNVIIHYKTSKLQAKKLTDELNAKRKNSATSLYADLTKSYDIKKLITKITKINLLVNNASVFYKTKIDEITKKDWDDIMTQNTTYAFFLSQKLSTKLAANNGNIINITDIHGLRPLNDYSVYSIAKAALIMLTKVLAKELAPAIRVNAVSPGYILAPDNNTDKKLVQEILKKNTAKKTRTDNRYSKCSTFSSKCTLYHWRDPSSRWW